MNKHQIVKKISNDTGLTTLEVKAVLNSLEATISQEISKDGPGIFILQDLLKIERKTLPPKPERLATASKTGVVYTLPAKPARDVFKIKPLAKLNKYL